MQLPKGIFLAPMVRASELAFRMLARRHGNSSLCYSPMLRDYDVLSVAASRDKFMSKDFQLRIDGAGRTNYVEETAYLLMHDTTPADTENLVVQLCGSCPTTLGSATTAILDIYSNNNIGILPSGIDLNLGCPQECAAKENFGAFLVEKDPTAAISCITSMRKSIDNHPKTDDNNKPLLSAKIRLLDTGVDDTIEFVRRLQSAGVDHVAIHCRHRTNKHFGNADWDSGAKIVAAFVSSELPIILNGGIACYNDATLVMEYTKCHAVMAATGYLRSHRHFDPSSNPTSLEPQWLASEYLELAEKYPPPSYLYIQKHLRWIFRDTLQPGDDPNFDKSDYSDWRVKLWSFLVRPYVRSIEQFRLFVALYVQLSGCEKDDRVPKSILYLVDDVSFGSVKKAGNRVKGFKHGQL